MLAQENNLVDARGFVARVLLQTAVNKKQGQRLAQRDIAKILGVGWDKVNLALKSLCQDGVIRIESNRITIKRELILKLVEVTIEGETTPVNINKTNLRR